MIVIERSVQEIGKSLLVTLPKKWARQLNIKKGTVLRLLLENNGRLSIVPEFKGELVDRRTAILFDEDVQRRFFKAYFDGNHQITIKFEKEASKGDLYKFLNRFMNVQIIEDTPSHIVVKCFRINELTLTECLQRMHFLSLTMFEKSNNTTEVRETITKFYYMLVMQVRLFLSEGKFVEDDKITLVRAMDFRIVAEKIQRIAELLPQLDMQKQIADISLSLKKYYSRSFGCFLNENFDEAAPLMQEGRKLRQRILASRSASTKATVKDALTKLEQIARYVEEISMFVR